jgi:pimeloyl-ACP methyl ester carboxylesterase
MTVKFERKTAQLGTGTLDYYVGGEAGTDEEGDARLPLVMLHGATGHLETEVHQMLAEGRRLYLPITPGHDGTAHVPGVDGIEALAALIAEFIGAEVGGRCDLLGYSLGGWQACWLAINHPEVVELLVLAGCAGLRPDDKGGMPKDPAELLRQLYAHPEKLPEDPRSAQIKQSNVANLAHYNLPEPLDQPLMDRLGDIQSLTLILHGTLEEIIPIETCRVLSAGIPNRYLVYIYDAAHGLHVDQPERFLEVVRDFLNRGVGFIVNQGMNTAAE